MKILFIFCFFFWFVGSSGAETKSVTSFQSVDLPGEEDTEAYFRNNTMNSEFCCDREYTSDWAQNMSTQESRQIVSRWLPFSQPYKSPRPAPPEGQR